MFVLRHGPLILPRPRCRRPRLLFHAQDIVRGDKEGAPARMTCVTAIEPSWIPALAEDSPLLSLSAPLASPPPIYDSEKETVMCRYGRPS